MSTDVTPSTTAEERLRQHLQVLSGREPAVPGPDESAMPLWLDRRPGVPWRRTGKDLVAVIHPVWAAPGDASVTLHATPQILTRVAEQLEFHLLAGERVEATPDGVLVLRLHHTGRGARPIRLQEMAYHTLEVLNRLGHDVRQVDLGVGWAPITVRTAPERALRLAREASDHSVRQRDFQPVGGAGESRAPRITNRTFALQVLAATLGTFLVPLALLFLLYGLGLDVSGVLYWVLVGSLTLTALMIWAEAFTALDPEPLPDLPEGEAGEAPPATAIIAAYLPNEAETILETLDSFLEQQYSGGLQVILAYNTPEDLPVEQELAELDARHPGLLVVRVHDSTSKAQNVNAALRLVTGDVVGIFDADHHPMPGAFERAWHWIANGADVVQGHCVIREAEDSRLAQVVAVEFEQLYAVAHPGRTMLHGFGIFGGSNGYWRRDMLDRLRLRGSYLTEDIEASIRLLRSGGRIVNDPGLVSRELAPATVTSWWRQRMRWAQGWFQVSLRHLWPLLSQGVLTWRQRAGIVFMLGWREIYPWIAPLTWPLLAFLAWRDEGVDMTSPIFFFLTLYIVSAGVFQTLVAWRVAVPEIRRHTWWFVQSALVNVVVYTGAKNLVNRVAHLKQLRGEREWVVTARTASTDGIPTPRHAAQEAVA
ncbi:glycosyltransferase [Nocardioides alkalitolerans]|uniref:glycosyltransferase n=1 Tax=Nocardioides alkalitolerans TaxID=281714 RepID=UPI0004256730|nr:glycosyltransferase family 2 protein [Nocardioides alkalitolerans]